MTSQWWNFWPIDCWSHRWDVVLLILCSRLIRNDFLHVISPSTLFQQSSSSEYTLHTNTFSFGISQRTCLGLIAARHHDLCYGVFIGIFHIYSFCVFLSNMKCVRRHTGNIRHSHVLYILFLHETFRNCRSLRILYVACILERANTIGQTTEIGNVAVRYNRIFGQTSGNAYTTQIIRTVDSTERTSL